MSSHMFVILSLALFGCPVEASASYLQFHPEDCGQKRSVYSFAQSKVPGAGLAKFEPFQEVLKDGFFVAGCMKDYLYEHGDKFGNNKHSYEMGGSSNVSMVHYTEVVPKEDQKSMTPGVCFDFCRTAPDMGFFGISNGRDCYCMPFFQEMASDNSMCDAVCEGDTTQMCGAKGKSSVFAMHSCADTAAVLADSASKASAVADEVGPAAKETTGVGEGMQEAGDTLQKAFGAAGDPVAAALFQEAKVFAGELIHAADAAAISTEPLHKLADEAKAMEKADLKNHEQAATAEKLVKDMDAATAVAEANNEVRGELHDLAQRGHDETGRIGQYYPLMYFVDKKFEDVPSTCGGDHDKRAIFGGSADNCAAACDAEGENSCVGFSYYPGLCFLFQKFTSVQYYTECKGASAGDQKEDEKKEFLQVSAPPAPAAADRGKGSDADVQCFAKLQHFEGVNMNPDGASCKAGKDKMCLKKANKAERCFETP